MLEFLIQIKARLRVFLYFGRLVDKPKTLSADMASGCFSYTRENQQCNTGYASKRGDHCPSHWNMYVDTQKIVAKIKSGYTNAFILSLMYENVATLNKIYNIE